jgi:hypothetical protein
MPFALTDHQLQLVLAACQPLAPEKRIVLMERIAAALRIQGIRRPANVDIERPLSKGLHGLMQTPAA